MRDREKQRQYFSRAQVALSIYNLLQCGSESVCVCVFMCQCVCVRERKEQREKRETVKTVTQRTTQTLNPKTCRRKERLQATVIACVL